VASKIAGKCEAVRVIRTITPHPKELPSARLPKVEGTDASEEENDRYNLRWSCRNVSGKGDVQFPIGGDIPRCAMIFVRP
jgi:hypothetical protein